MINYGYGIVGYVLAWISLIHASVACVISIVVVVVLIYDRYNHRLKREVKTTHLLSVYIYSFIFIYAITLISANIQTLLGDVYGSNFDSSWCIFRGYFICIICCAMYFTFVLQAVFRLCRIVYSNYRWLQSYWLFAISAPIQVIGASALLSPILIWHDFIYFPNDHYCFIPFTNIRGFLFVVFACYGVPLICLTFIYIRITLFIRQQTGNLTLAIRRRQERDLLAIRRIFINVGLLLGIGLPGIGVLLMSFITGEVYYLGYRILWIGAEVGVAMLSVEMILTTPQLRNLIIKRWHRIQVTTIIEGSIQMRHVATVF